MNKSKNEMLIISRENLAEHLKHVDRNKVLIVELDGKEILNKQVFVDIMQEKFKLPDKHRYRYSYDPQRINWNAFEDRMTELSWFPDEMNFILIIYHFQEFLKNDVGTKEKVLNIFKDILYFWEEEVLHIVVNGKTKEFNIYLVD